MFRTIGRIVTILLVATIIAGATYFLVQTLGAQGAASTMQQVGGQGGPGGGGPGGQSASLAGLGQVLLNMVEAGVVIGIVYPLQRWWLGRRQARAAQTRRVMAAAR